MSYNRRDLLAATGGVGLVGLSQRGAALSRKTADDPAAAVVYATRSNIAGDGTTDDTAQVQAIIDANPGKSIVFDGTMAISRTISVTGDNTTLIFRNGAGFIYATATMTGMRVSGNDVTLEGLNFTAPAKFDGSNAQPTYGVIWVNGDNCKFLGGSIRNVPKVGIMFSECEGGLVSQMRIEGNFPETGFQGSEVAHAGIVIDSASAGRQGNFFLHANGLAECVQGILIANYGPTSRSQGIVITGNSFHRCWNHGVYGAGISHANSVTDNAFINCQVPIALSGFYHVVACNTITTGGSSRTYTDEVGISLRDPVRCIVANNVIQGETGTNQVVINLMTSLDTIVRGNVVSGNTMEIAGNGSANLIRLGGMDCTDLTDNLIIGNNGVCRGRDQSGLVQLVGAEACPAHGTIVSANSAAARSASHCIQLVNTIGVSVVQNNMRLEHNAATTVQLAGIVASNCLNCDFSSNAMAVLTPWGRNVTLVGLWEVGTCSGNRASNNALRASIIVAAAAQYVTAESSGIVIDDFGPGAPAVAAGVGSTWRRSDGSPGATLYIKESGTGADGWVAK